MKPIFAALLFCLLLPPVFAADADPVQILRKSDQARGGGLPGLIWEIRSQNTGSQANEDDPPMRLLIKAADNASLAETLEPLRSKGARILQVERNMWLTKPGLKKPIPISPRQRLTGQAAIGDIAATNYVRDYTPVLRSEETIDGERCHVLDLTANTRQATYAKVRYWVSPGRGVAVTAAVSSVS
ncbi:MAG: outer membrane lipoprotein-sorting protein, partial [Betaproteobacteria bacterium]